MKLTIELPDECLEDAAGLVEWFHSGERAYAAEGTALWILRGSSAGRAVFRARVMGMSVEEPDG